MSGNLSTIRRFSWIVYAAVILSLLLPSAFAQTTISTGSIQGTITDQSGALVNGAKVIITNKAAGQTITLTTSSSGTYTSGSLFPGNYVVRVEAKGFQTSELPVTVRFGTNSISWSAGRTTRIEVDGSDITDDTVGTTTQNIPQDAIQEFQISQSTLDLSTELTSSGAVNVVTRTGTNSVHGDAYYGFRD